MKTYRIRTETNEAISKYQRNLLKSLTGVKVIKTQLKIISFIKVIVSNYCRNENNNIA